MPFLGYLPNIFQKLSILHSQKWVSLDLEQGNLLRGIVNCLICCIGLLDGLRQQFHLQLESWKKNFLQTILAINGFHSKNIFWEKNIYTLYIYRTRAIITRGLYTFYLLFEKQFMDCDLWPYVWLVFKSGF